MTDEAFGECLTVKDNGVNLTGLVLQLDVGETLLFVVLEGILNGLDLEVLQIVEAIGQNDSIQHGANRTLASTRQELVGSYFHGEER